jgi:hypothetical protein
MAKRRPARRPEQSKALTRRTVRERRITRRVVEEPEVEVVTVKPIGRRWFGVNPWIVIVGIIVVLLLIFLPIYPATKMVDKTETIMVPVQKERQKEVTVDETIKVYQGYLQEKGTSVARTGYTIQYDFWGNAYYVPYTYYDRKAGRSITVDAVDEIVETQQAPGPNDTWVVTLTSHDGDQIVYRDIETIDLTKTGKATVQVKKMVPEQYTEEEPQQVTRQEAIKIRVNLISLVFGNY